MIADYNSAGVLQRKYVYGPGIDEPISMIAGANTYYYHFDGLGSVVALSNTYGNVAERYSYNVFGEPNIRGPSGEPRATSQYGNPYMFTGREYDSETGLYYYRARYYKPSIGRFLQVDPIGYAGGLNLYTYVDNNPLNWVDPWGLCEEATKLSRREFMQEMRELKKEIMRLPPNQRYNLLHYLFMDSTYAQESNKDRLYYFEGKLVKGSELNYYAVGMLMKHFGWSEDATINLAIGWKAVNIPFSYPSHWCGITNEPYSMPTENEWYFYMSGYSEYNRPIREE